jgi:hypothetical protein
MFKKFEKIIAKCNTWFLVALILVGGIMASRTLFKHDYYFNMHDDLQMMRQLQLEKCFIDKQIPCRWVPDMGYGYGLPLFNYYPQLPYLFGEIFRVLSFNFNDTAKLTFAVGIIASGFSMYLLAKEFFGKTGGLLSSVFYVWAPYRALDVYVRGAMNESWAFVWFPLILWGIYRLIKTPKPKYFIVLALSLAAILLTHNIMVMIFAPVAAVWAIGWLITGKTAKPVIGLGLSGLFALGLSAFFTLPAVFEQKYVHIDSLVSGYFQYQAHFATLNQLFISRFWGDGPSAFGPNDAMAFPIGYVHWITASLVALLLALKIYKKRKVSHIDLVAIFALIVGTGAAFMSHERSSFIWINLTVFRFVQFPWRFLTLNTFGFALAAGYIFLLVKELGFLRKNISQAVVFLLLSVAVISLNWNFFKPVHGGPLTDEQKFSGEAWRLQSQAGILDYLPADAKDDPEKAADGVANIITGKGEISGDSKGTNWVNFDANLFTDSEIRINLFRYPVWNITIDGTPVKSYIPETEVYGRMHLNVPQGNHKIALKFTDTPMRTWANTISLISWGILVTYPLWKKKIRAS